MPAPSWRCLLTLLPLAYAAAGTGHGGHGRGRMMRAESGGAHSSPDVDELHPEFHGLEVATMLETAGPILPDTSAKNHGNENKTVNPPKRYGPFTMMGARDMMSFCKDTKDGIRCDSQAKGRKVDHFYLVQNLGAGWGGWSALQGGKLNAYCRVKLYGVDKSQGGNIVCDVPTIRALDDLGKFRFDHVEFDKVDGLGVKRQWECLRNRGAGGFCTNNIDRIDCSPKIFGSVQNDYFANTFYKAHTTTTTTSTTMTFSFDIVMPNDDNEDAEKEAGLEDKAAQKSETKPRVQRQEKKKKKRRRRKTAKKDEDFASGEPIVPQEAPDGSPPGAGDFR